MVTTSYDNRALGYLIGRQVAVMLTDQADGFTATLEAFDYPWVRLHHDDGRIACYPYQQIRLLALPGDAAGISRQPPVRERLPDADYAPFSRGEHR